MGSETDRGEGSPDQERAIDQPRDRGVDRAVGDRVEGRVDRSVGVEPRHAADRQPADAGERSSDHHLPVRQHDDGVYRPVDHAGAKCADRRPRAGQQRQAAGHGGAAHAVGKGRPRR